MLESEAGALATAAMEPVSLEEEPEIFEAMRAKWSLHSTSSSLSVTDETSSPPLESQHNHENEQEYQHVLEFEPPAPPNRSIYPLRTQPGYRVTIRPYDPSWATCFTQIATHLHELFITTDPPVPYTNIEHIGSTPIPTLAAKPNIDVLITLPNHVALSAAVDALTWELPRAPPFVSYTRVPWGGGIRGRESFKRYVPHWSPDYWDPCAAERSVYLVDEDKDTNPAGSVLVRCYRDVRDTLRHPANGDLLDEYASVKWRLSRDVLEDQTVYAKEKDPVIRKILKRAGWTDDEVDVKEGLVQIVDDDELPY